MCNDDNNIQTISGTQIRKNVVAPSNFSSGNGLQLIRLGHFRANLS